jgi:hypothetical protein
MKKVGLVFCMIAIFACTNNPVPKPDRLLDDEVMTDILYDLAILQAIDGSLPNKLTENNLEGKKYIYKKYKIDSITYYQNQRYYAADIKKYKEIYQEVLDRLDEANKKNDTVLPLGKQQHKQKHKKRHPQRQKQPHQQRLK